MTRKLAKRMLSDDRGTVVVLVGMGLTAMVGVAGLGTEAFLIYGVENRLQQSLDAAALAAGHLTEEAEMANEAEAVFMTNFFASGPTAALKDPGLEVSITDEGHRIALSAVAEYHTSLLKVVGIDSFQISGRTVVQREVRPTEAALVLDITGSMGGSKISQMRQSGAVLVDILFGNVEVHPNLFVSVVPYTSTVNIGSGHTDWLTNFDPADFADDPQGWKGCVMARDNGGDVTDDPPDEDPFEAFHWESSIDNEYPPVKPDQHERNDGTGPNLGCGLPILPLTNVKATVKSKIEGLEPWYRGGTTSNLGMVWGWRTVSPRWRGLWGLADRPLDYDATETRKAVVILTDGENQFWDNYTQSGEGESPGGSDFTGYGRLADLGEATNGEVDSKSDGVAELNARFLQVCDALKASDVDVFTITYGLNRSSQQDTRDVFLDCASKPEYYFNSPNPSDLENVFRHVGTKLSSLRIIE